MEVGSYESIIKGDMENERKFVLYVWEEGGLYFIELMSNKTKSFGLIDRSII